MADGPALFRKSVVLSNGARHPIGLVAAHVGLLESYADGDARDRDVLDALRRTCLGLPISGEARHALQSEKLLDGRGEPPPALKDVVLSSVRGDGKALHVLPPFTDPWDRTIANLFLARAAVRSQLSPENAELLLNEPGFGGDHDTPEQIRKWTDYVREHRGQGLGGGANPLDA